MAPKDKPPATRPSPAEQAMRDQEVLRANRELAAYFKGRRTEREARAALKTIKSFVRDRERLDPKVRAALPTGNLANLLKKITSRRSRPESGAPRRRGPRRKPPATSDKAAAVESLEHSRVPPPESDEPTTT